jgi:ferredoxin-NADP reductase
MSVPAQGTSLTPAAGGEAGGEEPRPQKARSATPDDVAALFAGARRVVIVPGYGMAVSQAHHTLRDLMHVLQARGIAVEFGVHPVAGRMPGHMNVLLAEADIPYEAVKDLEEINPSFAEADLALVIGANDIVNPLAPSESTSPLAGLPVLDVEKARKVVVVNRSLRPGYAGVANPLFSSDHTTVVVGDGRQALLEVMASLIKSRPKVAERRMGTVTDWRQVSPLLGVFRLMPQEGTRFPEYKPGQYVALRREDCRLTRRVVDRDGKPRFVPDLDERGVQRRGPVTHSYTISSAPFETRRDGHLEFYVVLEADEWGYPGRLTESLFRIRPALEDRLGYVERIVGDFTLDRRAKGHAHVVMVGTGTGLAPFASMAKQLHHEAAEGRRDGVRYTLFHANRTPAELVYHDELVAIEKEQRFDFAYVAAVSRPRPGEGLPSAGKGRANNLLRRVFGMPMREEEDVRAAEADGTDAGPARAALAGAVRPELPAAADVARLRERMPAGQTVLLSCGNPAAMEDTRRIAEANGLRFEKEDW